MAPRNRAIMTTNRHNARDEAVLVLRGLDFGDAGRCGLAGHSFLLGPAGLKICGGSGSRQ